MKTLLQFFLVGVLLTGCGKSDSTYQLILGQRPLDLRVHKDPKLIQDELVSHLRPLWEELVSGDSITFQCRRTGPLDLGADVETARAKAQEKVGGAVRITSTQTVTVGVYRFFKGRNGANGIEQLAPGQEPFTLVSGPALEWGFIERYLREQVFSLPTIRSEIQFDRNR